MRPRIVRTCRVSAQRGLPSLFALDLGEAHSRAARDQVVRWHGPARTGRQPAEHASHRFVYRLTGPWALMITWKAAGGNLSLHLPAALRAATMVRFTR